MKRYFLFAFYLLAGIIIGSLIGNICADILFLSWLNYGNTIGFSANNPAVLDLIIIKLTLGFSMTISVAQIICVVISMSIYNRIR